MRAAPTRVLLLPLVIFALLCGLGLYGVLYTANQRIIHEKSNVTNGMATEIAAGLKLQIENTQSATVALVAYVHEQPYCDSLNKTFPLLAATVWEWASVDGSQRSSPPVSICAPSHA